MDLKRPSAKSPIHDPGGRSMVMTAPNPKRTSSKDIRLLADGRKRQKLSHSPDKVDANRKHHGINKAEILKTNESGSSDQSASKWFDDVNKNVPRGTKASNQQVDNDPPFYMSNQPSYFPTNFVASESDRIFGNGNTTSRFDSENEDLRGVIDDLTVENKRLRQLVKHGHKQRRGTPSDISQQQDKLFEVRMHGLPPEKRRELEYLLKNFATSVHTSIPSKSNSGKTSPSSVGHPPPRLKPANTDSGYASNSNSGQSSALHMTGTPAPAPQPYKSKSIKNYLHDIPDNILPRRNPIMSERAKMALVVRRLEQLFTGRKADPGDHSQPMQQQEVSQSAARADRVRDARNNLKRRPEGNREAHVMPPDSKVNLDAMDMSESKDQTIAQRLRPENSNPENTIASRPGSPDQRPTRPLDLDIHRAQVAADNIQYIKHLGLYEPDLHAFKEGQESNWMYLNLLSSMAQLHTLNVTPDFIRKAIKKLSRHFDLSKDGYKVRWVGPAESTVFAPEDEKALEVVDVSPQDSAEDAGNGGSSKRSKTNSTSNAAGTSNTPSDNNNSGLQTSSDSKLQHQTTTTESHNQSSNLLSSNLLSSNQQASTKPTTQGSAFDYKPIVYRERPHEEYAESYLRDSDESFDTSSGDSSGLVHALSKSNLNQQTREEGPITFFNNAYFCSDFSNDNIPSNMLVARPAIIGETLGVAIPQDIAESPLRHHDATYFATEFAAKPYQSNSQNDPKLQIAIPELQPLTKAGEEETIPRELDASGIGGTSPDDNFAVDIKTNMTRIAPGKDAKLIRKLPFSGRKYAQRYRYNLNKSHKVELMPSKLPPASYIFFTSSSSSNSPDGEDDESETSDESSSRPGDIEPPPPAFLMEFTGGSGERSDEDEDDKESSSIDMLALARQADPRQIAEAERVYMINQPGGIARRMAGSLAATVGASRSSSSVHEPSELSSASSHNGSAEAVMDVDEE